MVNISVGVSSKLGPLAGRDFLSSSNFNKEELVSLLHLASQLKSGERRIDLGNRVLGLIFTKASTRTRVSFQVAMARLGGQTIDLNPQSSQLGRGEPLKDTARVLSGYCDALAIRTFAQQELIEYAEWASIPVINALTDLEHPCQILADFFTIQESFNSFEDQTIVYIGDGNNVANSLMLCGAILGVNIRICTPKGFEPNALIIKKAREISLSDSKLKLFNNPLESVIGANVLYTDVWASMGQENEQIKRKKAFSGFCLDEVLLSKASKDAVVLHCLPAHRGEEISNDLIEGKNSRVFEQAENRLHVQQALLATLLGGL